MKKMLVCALVVGLLAWGGSAFAQGKVWDDLSWWGKSGATPAPVKDGRDHYPCYWWWPLKAKSNVDDKETWGNRGVVYSCMAEEKIIPPPPPPPPPPKPPKPTRSVPALANVLFDFDKAVLKPEGKAECDKAVAEMKKFGKDTVLIEGHTCDIGSDQYNMGLGQRRADAVKKYLVEQGIDEKRITTKSLGKTQPAVPNTNDANRKLNRRVMFKYTLGE